MQFALNQMTAPGHGFEEFVSLAARVGVVGVELRNDLARPLFDGAAPDDARSHARAQGQRILALAELPGFNRIDDTILIRARALAKAAQDCGAPAIALIPRNDGERMERASADSDLSRALSKLAPILADHDVTGWIEPLGFRTCNLRDKGAVLNVIDALGLSDRFALIHDTFHHCLAGGGPVFADRTAMVHISGVTADIPLEDMTDAHRGLVDADDRLNSCDQVSALLDDGYAGPVSFEPFAPDIHRLPDPAPALIRSIRFVETRLARAAA